MTPSRTALVLGTVTILVLSACNRPHSTTNDRSSVSASGDIQSDARFLPVTNDTEDDLRMPRSEETTGTSSRISSGMTITGTISGSKSTTTRTLSSTTDTTLPSIPAVSSDAIGPTEQTPVTTSNTIPQTSTASTASSSITMIEVAKHNQKTDCWTVIHGDAYNMTSFFGKHPGGDAAILKSCGIDSTAGFERKHGGQEKPETTLKAFYIGHIQQ